MESKFLFGPLDKIILVLAECPVLWTKTFFAIKQATAVYAASRSPLIHMNPSLEGLSPGIKG